MKFTIIVFIALLFSCSSERTRKLSRKDSIDILNTALADRIFLQEQLSHKKVDTIHFVKGKLVSQNIKLDEKYFKFIYVDSSLKNARETRSFYEKDPRIRIGITKFQLDADTLFLTLKNYGAEFYYIFRFEKNRREWELINSSGETSY